ncbi:MAG: CRTAC1 family protein [Planctomycetota bacterium]|nr:CRTAC1 family protein [Planctomycetota bacterium]
MTRPRTRPTYRSSLAGLSLSALLATAACDDGTGVPFRDITAQSGIAFTHTVDLTGQFRLPEIMGAGCAVFDANGDDRLDIYFTNAGRCGGQGAANRLYLQNPDATFHDATTTSGLGDPGFGMGVAIGDIDNDGDLDVYVGNFGADALYRNEGKGTFTNITQPAGIVATPWTSSVSFLDYDADGWLDIFVVHYVADDLTRYCTNRQSRRDFCGPTIFEGVPDRIYRNRGDGTFEDRSEASGIASVASNGLGILVEDFNDDAWPDVFIANDGEANHLWMNQQDGSFRETALSIGVAVNAHGTAEASMGVAAGDVDADGDLDLFMTHLLTESNTLYLGSNGSFEDGSARSGLATCSIMFTGFGTALIDIELDGDLDLLVANGRVQQGTANSGASLKAPWNKYAETNQLFFGDGRGRFVDASDRESVFCHPAEVSRGLAFGDLDADGDLDVVLANCAGPARIYENIAKRQGHWLRIRAVDPKLRRDVYGAVVWVHAGGKIHRRTIGPSNSYLSCSPAAAHFGLGSSDRTSRIEVRWPGGGTETFEGGPTDRTLILERGKPR